MVIHLESDILECKIKWVLGSITTNKAGGGDGIPAELFQVLKDGAVQVLNSICQQIWKTQQWPQDWKRSVFILIPKEDSALLKYTKALTVWITTNCGKFLKRQMYQNTLTYLLKNLYAGQESTVRTRQGTMD